MAEVTTVIIEAESMGRTSGATTAAVTDEHDDEEEPKSTSIAIQANDYEIERGSGVLPARRRIIPFKFRDYHDPTIVIKDEESDDEYSPSEQIELKKKPRYGKPGRPRKNPVDHTYEKGDENVEKGTEDEEADTNPGLGVPKRGRPVKTESRGESEKIFKCPTCKKGFSQKGNLKVHQKIHKDERPFKCDHDNCSKAFRANEALRRHKLSHLGIKLFKCDICEKDFSSNVALKEHMSRHTNDKPHDCPHCDKKFRQISCMRRHILTHTNIKPYECPVCEMRFSQMIYVRSHMKRHTGEKPFKCTICDKSFAHHSDLNRHKTVHSGEKPYDCEVCGAKFTDPSSRRRHVKEHFGFKPYQCMLCEDNFKRADQLKSHLNKKHDCKVTTGPYEMMEDTPTITQEQKNSGPGMHVVTDAVGNVFQVVQDKDVIQLLQQEIETIPEQAKDGNYQMQKLIRHLENGEEVQVVQQPGEQVAVGTDQVQVLQEVGGGEIQVLQIAGNDRDHTQQVILKPAPGQETQELLQEQTEQILAQIRSQLQEQAGTTEDGLPVQVSYQIIHDDENQQIVEIQYINAPQEEEGVNAEDASIQDVTSQIDANSQSEINSQTEVLQITHAIENVHNMLDPQPAVSQATDFESSGHIAVADMVDDTDDTVAIETTQDAVAMAMTPLDSVECESNTPDHSIPVVVGTPTNNNEILTSHYIRTPDFNCQEYYNWLSNFTDLCKLVTMPLAVQLFQNISHVHKTLSDVLANPKGILTNRENFRVLMTISTELNSVINEHLSFVLEKLNNEEASENS